MNLIDDHYVSYVWKLCDYLPDLVHELPPFVWHLVCNKYSSCTALELDLRCTIHRIIYNPVLVSLQPPDKGVRAYSKFRNI